MTRRSHPSWGVAVVSYDTASVTKEARMVTILTGMAFAFGITGTTGAIAYTMGRVGGRR